MRFNYEQLQQALGLDKKIINIRYCWDADKKEDCMEIIFDVYKKVEAIHFSYRCGSCGGIFKEPSELVAPSCRFCGSEYVKIV